MSQFELLKGTRFGVIADAHIHPGKTPAFPATLSNVFRGVDAILALGDMGEASSLDTLERLAPVYAVQGEDDAGSDARVGNGERTFAVGSIAIGAVFDAVKSGFFESSDPLVPKPHLSELLETRFGRRIDVFLCASTHKPFAATSSGVLIVNPGSPTLADKRTVAILAVGDAGACAEHIEL